MSELSRNTNELLFLEWVVINRCNFNCYYCVNKQFLESPNYKRPYLPGIEVEIAKKIAEIAEHFNTIRVNMTGGEPLLAKDIGQALGILAKVPNVGVTFITNFKLIEKIERYIPSLAGLHISLHIKYRDEKEVLKIIRLVNKYKRHRKVTMTLSQVDCDLTDDDRRKLALITSKTGEKICFQVFVRPWGVDAQVSEEGAAKPSASLVNTLGKRCAIGKMFYRLEPQGSFVYGLWCDAKRAKIGNFLAPFSENRNIFLFDELDQCPQSYCRCNYNTYEYEAYLRTCKKLGYKDDEIMPPSNLTDVGLSQSRESGERVELLSRKDRKMLWLTTTLRASLQRLRRPL